MFILASSVCKSLQYLTSALTQGVEGDHLFRLTCSVVPQGGRNTANKYHQRVWGVLAVSGPHWVCPHSRRVCFSGLHCSVSRLLCRGTDKAGPGLHVLPRSKSLRFRLFHIPQRHRLLCFLPFSGLSSLGDQVLGEHTLPRWVVCLITSPVPAAWFPGCATGVLSEVCCVSALGS